MSTKIPEDKVIEYIRNTLEPVSYEVLISKFCSSKADKETRNAVKAQLQDILVSNVKSGSLMHYRNHFYCSSLSDDLQELVDLDSEIDLSSDLSQISFTSCESVIGKRSAANVDEVEEIISVNSSSDLSERKSAQSSLSLGSEEISEEPKPKKK
ncbi:hypothetical protein ACLKA7_003735 [Drosophila subpalustris]